MAQLIEAEKIKSNIQSHGHFNEKCLPKFMLKNFEENKHKLEKCRYYFDDMKNTEKDILDLELGKKNIEQQLNNLKILNDQELDNLKLKLNNREELHLKEKENYLNNLKNSYNNYELKSKYDIESLNKDIENIKTEIQLKEEGLKYEIDYKKQEELLKLKNEFKIKLIQYTNKKKLEKQEKEKEREIRQKKYEADKAIELNELSKKALLVQKIILSVKNISLI